MDTLQLHPLIYRSIIRPIKKCGLAVAVCVLLMPVCCQAWPARVVKIIDGDIIAVVHNKQLKTIRLFGIDCPEADQPYGNSAVRFLSEKARGQQADIQPVMTDQQGRVMAMVYIDGECINETLIKKGLAWVSPQYCRKEICVKWNRMQHQASMTSKGLWNRRDAMPPWLWRQQR